MYIKCTLFLARKATQSGNLTHSALHKLVIIMLPKYVQFDKIITNVVFRAEKLDTRVKVKDATASIDGKNFVVLVGCNGKTVDIIKNDVNVTVWFVGEERNFEVQDIEETAREIVSYLTTATQTQVIVGNPPHNGVLTLHNS